MYHCTYLVNRQMITEPSQIMTSLQKYVSEEDGKPMSDFIYRLEWYRIGISIPMDVYSEKRPVLQLRPECQLTSVEELEALPAKMKEASFKIFIVPYKAIEKNEDLDKAFIEGWLQKKLKGIAEITESMLGPNNRIYFKDQPDDVEMTQIQSYTLRGELKVLDSKKLDTIRKKALGYYSELGCGMLVIE